MSDCWKVVAASVIGVSHEKVMLPCQDAHRWLVLPGGLLLVAMADGAGSAALADVGAAVAVEAAIGRLAELVVALPWLKSEDGLSDVLRAGRAAVEAEAERRAAELRYLACTLIV